ncbi:hypothetical protein Pcinc_002132 [Petrolisthes cinctipes]|uniref:DNA helicase Pif1-like 2B domain-containing protein n=1 Tax=Petrolisthes cinctipes TaxID=88211 RepID=A0AAE1L2J5_PETCI|nr:hypothetical protein Pcinc_002132 [Petrolisthes cinctipes]
MRVRHSKSGEVQQFADYLLSVGEGREKDEDECITLPDDMLLPIDSTINDLCSFIYPASSAVSADISDISHLAGRGILAPLNKDVEEINKHMVQKLLGEERVYTSVDTVTNPDIAAQYQLEDHHCHRLSGFPDHVLRLKLGAHVNVIRNLYPSMICNGTKLLIIRLNSNSIQGKTIEGRYAGEIYYIPRIVFITQDDSHGVPFKQLQFPLRLAYEFTINKSQGNTLDIVGGCLRNPVFTHDQLYILLSRATSRSNIKVLTTRNNTTRNVVYEEVFHMRKRNQSSDFINVIWLLTSAVLPMSWTGKNARQAEFISSMVQLQLCPISSMVSRW